MTLSWLYNNQYIQQLHEEIKTNKLLLIYPFRIKTVCNDISRLKINHNVLKFTIIIFFFKPIA